jgi:hypothetical protein
MLDLFQTVTVEGRRSDNLQLANMSQLYHSAWIGQHGFTRTILTQNDSVT